MLPRVYLRLCCRSGGEGQKYPRESLWVLPKPDWAPAETVLGVLRKWSSSASSCSIVWTSRQWDLVSHFQRDYRSLYTYPRHYVHIHIYIYTVQENTCAVHIKLRFVSGLSFVLVSCSVCASEPVKPSPWQKVVSLALSWRSCVPRRHITDCCAVPCSLAKCSTMQSSCQLWVSCLNIKSRTLKH